MKSAGAAVIVVALVVTAPLAPQLAPYDPTQQSLADTLAGPNAHHWLGTDEFGRDVLSRLIYGSRVEPLRTLVGWAPKPSLQFGS